jgi:hypothetical protein
VKLLALILGTMLAISAHANSVHFIGFDESTPETAIPSTFDDRTRSIEIDVDGAAGMTGSLHADLFQVAGQLALPLVKNLELQKTVTLAEATHLRFSLKFPAVKRRTEILVRLTLSSANPTALGEIKFEVFPKTTTKELVDALQARGKPVLFGPGNKLRQFLQSQHVPFDDGGEELPDNFTSNLLYIGELKDAAQFQELQDRTPNARVLAFAPDETLPSGVYVTGKLARVTSPPLDHLPDDPRAQLALTKIINLLSNP